MAQKEGLLEALAPAGRAEQVLARMCAHGTLQGEDGQETCKAATQRNLLPCSYCVFSRSVEPTLDFFPSLIDLFVCLETASPS